MSRCLLALVLATGCARPDREALVFSIEQALVTTPAGADLAEVVPGDWDRVCVFRPHTPNAAVDSAIGAHWEGMRDTGLATSDTAALLVFARGGAVVEHVVYPRSKGDFATVGAETWFCRPRDDAVFQMRHPIEGTIPWIGPVGRQ